MDHFGGAEGAIDRNNVADPNLSIEKQLASGKTVILAPEGFLKHAISENVYAGIAMARACAVSVWYSAGKRRERSTLHRHRHGTVYRYGDLIAPTYEIGEDVPKLTIDGLEIEFQLTPGTEAPAEMNAYFPKYRALWMAENCTGTLHNLYTCVAHRCGMPTIGRSNIIELTSASVTRPTWCSRATTGRTGARRSTSIC